MSGLASKFKADRTETILSFVWHHWSRIGGVASGGQERTKIVDPEPLLLLTLEVARQDPRMFDATLDWLGLNGKWINVVRLTTLLERDQVCEPRLLGAVAAVLAQSDRTPKWKTLAKRYKPEKIGELEALFQKNGQPLVHDRSRRDPVFEAYGYMREPIERRNVSSPVLTSGNSAWTASSFMFKARALFGVNIRADVFTYLALQRASNPTRIAKDLGYSQRRVHDALADMAASGIFKVRTIGRSREYVFEAGAGWSGIFGGEDCKVEWYDWRAMARALSAIWRRLGSIKEKGASEYILTSEEQKAVGEVQDDLIAAEPTWKGNLKETLASISGFGWKRMWLPRGKELGRDSRGYPVPPSADPATTLFDRTDAHYFSEIEATPCLVLLGEPGMGKTYSLKEERNRLIDQLERSGGKILFRDLRSCGSESQLVGDLFESEAFASWERGEIQLHIFLDSLDEALLTARKVATVLSDRFRSLPSTTGLHLRIACRTADWSGLLENSLKEAWGDENFNVLELVELTQQDVAKAAETREIDGDAFLSQVAERDVSALAMKPVTLNFLLKSWRETGNLDARQLELYTEGCHLLCEESNESRIGAKLTGKLTAEQRMDIAGHIAVATIFSNRNAIWKGSNQYKAPKEALTLDELCQGTVGPGKIIVSKSAVLETLDTGLFSGRGPDQLGWAHQTYAEFLAARYLKNCGASSMQIMSLLSHPGGGDRKLIPQLHETAAWIAGMDKTVFSEIMKHDPVVLLGSDISTASNEDRRHLVDAVLTLYEEDELWDRDWSLSSRYGRLKHPELAAQLSGWILDNSKKETTRRNALDMARACDPKALSRDMLIIALDLTEPISLRSWAALVIAEHGDEESMRRLKPLALGSADSDPKQEIKGCALMACWPEYLTAAELFSSIEVPTTNSFYGPYQRFLTDHLIQHLERKDLSIALKWVAKQVNDPILDTVHVVDRVIDFAVKHVDDEGILDPLAAAIVARCQDDYYISQCENTENWRKEIASSRSTRRKLACKIFQTISDSDKLSKLDVVFELKLIECDDLLWLFELLDDETSDETKESVAHVVRRIIRPDSVSSIEVDALLEAVKDYKIFDQVLGDLIKPIEIDSEQAGNLRKYLKNRREREAGQEAREVYRLEPPVAERIDARLKRIENGVYGEFWLLIRELNLKDSSRHYGDDSAIDLTEYPGWKNSDAISKNRILAAAGKYLCQWDSNPDEWFSKGNIVHMPASAGVKALYLLQKEAPTEFCSLDSSVWRNWMPIVLAHPIFDNQDAYRTIAKCAFESAPDSALEWLPKVIDMENSESGVLSVLNKIDIEWNDSIGEILFEKLSNGSLKNQPLGQILELLLARKHGEAERCAKSLIKAPLSEEPNKRELTLLSAEMLMTHCSDGGWDLIWSAIAEDQEFGRVLMERIASRHCSGSGKVLRNLKEDQIADLFTWMSYQYPPENDPPEPEGAHTVDGPRAIKIFKGSMLGYLRNQGSPDSVAALEKLVHEFPAYKWLKRLRADAQAVTRRRTWQPLKPAELFNMVKDSDRRLVQSGAELLDVVIETLQKLDVKLQGETPMAPFLWDGILGKKVFRPKEENALSDYMKDFLKENLDDRGVVVNREVETRRGEKTDIHVAAVIQSNGRKLDQVSVIIEVKGSWNRELFESMETQLVNRYLKDNTCQYGLYLVGCFNCEKWDDDDYRNKTSQKRSCDEIRNRLNFQAAGLSRSGMTIKSFVLNTTLR